MILQYLIVNISVIKIYSINNKNEVKEMLALTCKENLEHCKFSNIITDLYNIDGISELCKYIENYGASLVW